METKKQESKPNKYDLPFGSYPAMENQFKDKKFSLFFASENGQIVLIKDADGKLYSVEKMLSVMPGMSDRGLHIKALQ